MRAAVYLRVSLDATGQQLAVSRQREDCQRIALSRGWQIAAEYVDNSVSASDSRKVRPAYRKMVEAYQMGAFDALICWDLDRLTRQPRELEDWIDAAADRGLVLVTANGEADLSTDGGRMFARIKASVARAEIERKSARQTRAALQRSEMGKPPMGVRLTGYTTSGEVIESEAVLVKTLFRLFAEGDSLRAMAKLLEDQGIKTRHGKPWNPSSVRTILVNPRYAGRAIYQGKTTGKDGAWKPLVAADTFDLVQARLSDPRRRTQVGTDRKFIGSGLYLCGVCGVPVRSRSGNRYGCPKGCLTRSRTAIDELVVKLIRARLALPDLAQTLLEDQASSVSHLVSELEALRTRLKVVAEDYDTGLIDGQRYAVASEKITSRLDAIQGEIVRASQHEAALLNASDPVKAFDEAPLMLKRATINALCVVRLRRVPRGRKGFDPESVTISWRGGSNEVPDAESQTA